MNPLTPCVISEGMCQSHGRFRLTAAQFDLAATCPSCKHGEPVEMRQMGGGFTRKKMPYSEATDLIFKKWSNTVQMPNTQNNLPEGM